MNCVDFSPLGWRDAADVALQRTHHLVRFPGIGSVAFRAWRRNFPQLLYVEAMLRKDSILAGAMQDARAEFDEIRQFLGDHRVERSMDIGCGHALIDLWIYREYRCHLHLVDIEQTQSRHHEWHEKGAGYASLASAKKFLARNGVPAGQISLTNPQKTELADENCDLIFSLLSAGFHYPVEEYARFAHRALRPGGIFIFDARKHQDHSASTSLFATEHVIHDSSKHRRIALVR